MIWNESIECMDREQLREIQSRRLVKMAEYVYHNTPFYRKKFQEMGLEPGDIKSIDDITKLPFTNKLDLRDNYPFGLAAVPMSQIVRIHASSGTTGKPVVVLYTRKDLAMWAEAISRAFTWWTGCPRRCHEHRSLRHPHLFWQHPEADDADARFRHDHPLLHTFIRHVPGRGHERVRVATGGVQTEGWSLRR